jgi:hypothetical protein
MSSIRYTRFVRKLGEWPLRVGHSLPVGRVAAPVGEGSSSNGYSSELGAKTFAQRLGYSTSLRR